MAIDDFWAQDNANKHTHSLPCLCIWEEWQAHPTELGALSEAVVRADSGWTFFWGTGARWGHGPVSDRHYTGTLHTKDFLEKRAIGWKIQETLRAQRLVRGEWPRSARQEEKSHLRGSSMSRSSPRSPSGKTFWRLRKISLHNGHAPVFDVENTVQTHTLLLQSVYYSQEGSKILSRQQSGGRGEMKVTALRRALHSSVSSRLPSRFVDPHCLLWGTSRFLSAYMSYKAERTLKGLPRPSLWLEISQMEDT